MEPWSIDPKTEPNEATESDKSDSAKRKTFFEYAAKLETVANSLFDEAVGPDLSKLLQSQQMSFFIACLCSYLKLNGLLDISDEVKNDEFTDSLTGSFSDFYKDYMAELKAMRSIEELKYMGMHPNYPDTDDVEKLHRQVMKILIERLFDGQIEVIPPTIRTTFPHDFVEPLDKISCLAFAGELTGGKKELRMESRRSATKITTIVETIFDAQFNGAQKFTRFDGEVYCAICTLKEAGNSFATPRMIYQAMSGHKGAVPSQTQAGSIEESINKFIYTRIIINAEAEGKMRGIDGFVYDGPMLHANWEPGPVNLNGQIVGEGGSTVKCLRILEQPILYEYASRKNQIGRVSIEILNTPIRKTEETIILQSYLRRRIHAMQGGNSNIIRYDTIYKEVSKVSAASGEADNPANVSAVELSKRRAAIRGHVKKILDNWQAAGLIKAYSETSKGRTIYSVTISKQATDQPLSQKKRQPTRA